MHPQVSLESIEFKSKYGNGAYLSSVRVNLSNGVSSPVFEDPDQTHYNHETISFDPNKPISSVRAMDLSNGAWNLKFFDNKGEEFTEYSTSFTVWDTSEYEIGEDEEIIGVYGVKNEREDKLSSFGFILKVKSSY